MDAHGRVHARTLARRAAQGGAAALVPPGKGVGGVLGVLYQSAELVTCAAAKRTQRARRSAEGTEGRCPFLVRSGRVSASGRTGFAPLGSAVRPATPDSYISAKCPVPVLYTSASFSTWTTLHGGKAAVNAQLR
jgi:hypothetical protein